MAAPLVGDAGPTVSGAGDMLQRDRSPFALARGREFYKLTGSGNDFVFFDERGGSDPDVAAALRTPDVIAAVCDRRNGVGADGVVFVEAGSESRVRIAYFNRDGSRAALCGNATLCAARLASLIGAVADPASPFVVETDVGAIEARVGVTGDPTIALGPVRDVEPDARGVSRADRETRIGYAVAGVPHLVILVDDADAVDLAGRGPALRAATRERPDGANVNWVSRIGDRWRMRTFERGVEGETLACGTGAVAAATLIARWTDAPAPVVLVTSSGRPVQVTVASEPNATAQLAGEGRLVFRGLLTSLDPALEG